MQTRAPNVSLAPNVGLTIINDSTTNNYLCLSVSIRGSFNSLRCLKIMSGHKIHSKVTSSYSTRPAMSNKNFHKQQTENTVRPHPENSFFGLNIPKAFRPWLILLIVLLALGGTWYATGRQNSSKAKLFSARPSAAEVPSQTANPAPAAVPESAATEETAPSRELESNVFEPGSASYYLNEAVIFYRQGKYENALENLVTALSKEPNDPEIHFNLGATLNKLGRMNDSIEAYQRALELSPDYDEAHNNLGRILMNKGELDLAETHFKDALKINPRNYNAHNNYGIIFIRRKMPAKAEKHFLEAVSIDPDYIEAYVNLGHLYTSTGRAEQARAAFNNALRVDPDFQPAIEGLQRLESIDTTPPMLLRPRE